MPDMNVKRLNRDTNHLGVDIKGSDRRCNHLGMNIKHLDRDVNCLGAGLISGLSGKAILIR